ncbi:ABC transporter substrate-binding protein [Noviherbaspirillum sedimenti]|uniref:Leucine-binding protein domain-containing protein n=1 Tax=Noviherbaspirillum sedimenti TaxID=2320865 RepID=A0A3A3GEK5_9BURK|nr:ABC transporter substrate-binding protein [Noviherbaspirillum sedimenti]RJG00676.1 hypothetical protein D3878_02990 [Noviherbaspirillum sedimenti]
MSNQKQHQGNSRHSVITPYQVGMLMDRSDAAHQDLHDAVMLALEESRDMGELDRPVKLVVRDVNGAPDGSVLDAEAAWRELNDGGMMMAMIGPFDEDNGGTVRDLIEAHAIPTLTYCASDAMTGKYCFQLPLGHPADISHRLLRHARSLGHAKVVLVRETGPRGATIEAAFRQAAAQDCFEDVEVAEYGKKLAARLALFGSRGAEVLIYLGGEHHAEINEVLASIGWNPLRLTGLELAKRHPVFGKASSLEGWGGVEAVHPENKVFQRFVQAFESRYGRKADHAYAAVGYDIGRMIAATLATVRPPSPEGVRSGLDQVRMMLSAVGVPGTVISFARYDHRGFKGDPYLLA